MLLYYNRTLKRPEIGDREDTNDAKKRRIMESKFYIAQV